MKSEDELNEEEEIGKPQETDVFDQLKALRERMRLRLELFNVVELLEQTRAARDSELERFY